MRLPRVRFTVRGMMLVVALTAAGLGVYASRSYGGRRAYYLDRAKVWAGRRQEFAAKAVEARQRARAFLKLAETVGGDPGDRNRKWAEDELLRERLFRRGAEYDARQERRFR